MLFFFGGGFFVHRSEPLKNKMRSHMLDQGQPYTLNSPRFHTPPRSPPPKTLSLPLPPPYLLSSSCQMRTTCFSVEAIFQSAWFSITRCPSHTQEKQNLLGAFRTVSSSHSKSSAKYSSREVRKIKDHRGWLLIFTVWYFLKRCHFVSLLWLPVITRVTNEFRTLSSTFQTPHGGVCLTWTSVPITAAVTDTL